MKYYIPTLWFMLLTSALTAQINGTAYESKTINSSILRKEAGDLQGPRWEGQLFTGIFYALKKIDPLLRNITPFV